MRAHREDARLRQGSKCDYCLDPITAKTATADHVIAQAKFGTDHRNNIVAACGHCNIWKGSKTVVTFRKLIEAPPPGSNLNFWLIHSRLRMNRRIELFQKRMTRLTCVAA